MSVVLVVTSAPPLVEGGHLVMARALVGALREAGHEAGIVTTPSNRFGRQGAAYLATWLTDVGQTGTGKPVDRVITLRFPSFAVRHAHQVCWLNHTMREYYDLWGPFSERLSPGGRLKEGIRRAAVHAADSYCFPSHVRTLFAISKTVQARLSTWNHVPSTVLYPPPPERAYRTDRFGDFFLLASRLSPLKRADLLLRAMAEPAAQGTKAVIAGDGEDLPRLCGLAATLGVADRVTFAGHVGEAELVDYLARCRAVVFVPKDEDYGLVTAEAFASGKAVITTTDSGGPSELVRDGENGLVVDPTPSALARALAQLAESPPDAERLGLEAKRTGAAFSWPAAVDTLMRA